MSLPPTWLAIAFLRGDPHTQRDRMITRFTQGPYVHTEIILAKGDDMRAYSSFEGVGGLVPCTPKSVRALDRQWASVWFPLLPGGYEKAYALILRILATTVPYNTLDLWQCCIKVCLPFEKDLDCGRPEEWAPRGVFCSQVALLFLRQLTRCGTVALSPDQTALVETTNSRGCSPNTLFKILAPPPA